MRIAHALLLSLVVAGIAIGQSPSGTPAQSAPSSPAAKSDLLIANALVSKNPDVRKQAVVALGLVGAREPYLSRLESMTNDKDVYVRLAVMSSLMDLKHPHTIPVLQKALSDEASEVSFAAAKALWTLQDDEGRKALLSVLGGGSKTGSHFLTVQKRDTLRMFHSPRTLLIFAMRQGAGFAPVPGLGEGITSLTDLLSDPSVSGRAATALLLVGDRSPEVTEALLDALKDKDASVRASAIHAFAMRGDPGQRTNIVPMLDDTKENVRLRAAAAYIRLSWIQENREAVRQFMESQETKDAPAAKAAPKKSGAGKK
jgi:HEAT repeat protein